MLRDDTAAKRGSRNHIHLVSRSLVAVCERRTSSRYHFNHPKTLDISKMTDGTGIERGVAREKSLDLTGFGDLANRARVFSEDSFGPANFDFAPASKRGNNRRQSSDENNRPTPGRKLSGDGTSPFNDSFGVVETEPTELFAKPSKGEPVRRLPGRTSSESSAFSFDSCFHDSGFDDFSTGSDQEDVDALYGKQNSNYAGYNRQIDCWICRKSQIIQLQPET